MQLSAEPCSLVFLTRVAKAVHAQQPDLVSEALYSFLAGGLTTSNGQIIDENGNTVVLKGFALSGMEISLTMSGNLLEGTDSIAHDWDTVMYR